jgi:pSer/pThr/pTyr-binding forkhead associated (FHA) protein
VTALFCNRCGHRNPEDANFCSSCGAPLEHRVETDSTLTTITFAPVESSGEVADENVVISLGDIPSGAGVLIVKKGPNAGSRFVLEKDVTDVGRHPKSDIFLDDVTVSRRHAEVSKTVDGFRVRDVGSLNGTYLNRERIDDAPIVSGDELQIGKFRIVFLTEGFITEAGGVGP